MHVRFGARRPSAELLEDATEMPGNRLLPDAGEHAGLRDIAVVPLRWQRVVQIAWIAISTLYVALFLAAIPARYTQLSTLTAITLGPGKWSPQLNPWTPASMRAALDALGFTPVQLALYYIAIECVRATGFALVGCVIFARKSTEWMALFVALLFVTFGIAAGVMWQDLAAVHPALAGLLHLLANPVWTAFLILFYVFPDGRFVPRWTIWLAVGLVVVLVPFTLPVQVEIAIVLIGFAIGLAAQVYRYLKISGPLQRLQAKWIMFALLVLLLGLTARWVLLPLLLPPASPTPADRLINAMADAAAFQLVHLLFPLSISMAILRYRLWDIDLLINRTVVYAALTGCVVGLYVAVVSLLGSAFQARSNLPSSLLATGVVAVLFQPLRDRLQRTVNRLMYGERDDPYAVVSRLARRLEVTLVPSAVLPTIVQTVQEALKLPYAAIALKQDEQFPLLAVVGTPVADTLLLPLVYQHEIVGRLILATRGPGEDFSPADRRLLDDLARQAGIAAHAVQLHAEAIRLNTDLQQSREALVTAREEERRRLRRDLHDGLGPALASLTLKVDAARDELQYDVDAAAEMLHRIKQDIQGAVADIRRLVYALRPPALDDFGLLGALRVQAAQYQDANLKVTFDAPETLPPLSAAVEVAAYRIVLEALTNVTRHAHAQTCLIRLVIGDALELEVRDDGCGLPPAYTAGVGMVSMRERTAELGGRWLVERIPGGGTRVWASLPVMAPDGAPNSPE